MGNAIAISADGKQRALDLCRDDPARYLKFAVDLAIMLCFVASMPLTAALVGE